MKKTIIKSFIIPFALMLTLGCASLINPNINNNISIAESGEFIPVTPLKDFYVVGDYFVLPQGKIYYQGEEYSVSKQYIVYPDGTSHNINELSFLEAGCYSLMNICYVNNKAINSETTILVYDTAYAVNKEGSSVNYNEKIITRNDKTSGVSGVLLEGDRFTYNEIIDISHSDNSVPIITYHTHTCSVLANHIGVDAYYSVVRLTDYYDETNYIDISIGHYVANHNTGRLQQYVVAGASNQSMTGCQPSNGRKASAGRKNVLIDGTDYICYFGTNDYGSMLDTKPGNTTIEQYGVELSNSDDNHPYSVFYDNETKQISVKHSVMHFITDLDDVGIYDTNTFKGFTTGEVILSLSFNTYEETSAAFDIEEIYGLKGKELNKKIVIDESAPVIYLDNSHTSFNIAVNQPFKVFNAYYKDLHPTNNGIPEISVYYDYQSENELYIPLINNTFTPKRPGLYTIIYFAKDQFGNTSEKILLANAMNVENKMIDFSVQEVNKGTAGTYVTLGKYSITSRNDEPQIKACAIYEDGYSYEIDLNTNKLFLPRVGKYEIKYEFNDGIYFDEYSYFLTSETSNVPYLETNTLPKYLIKNSKVSLPENKAISCANKELTYLPIKVYASNDNASYSSAPINTKEFEVKANQFVKFKYMYENEVLFISENIPVIDVGFTSSLNMLKYFNGDLATSYPSGNGICLTSNPNSLNTTEFINDLSISLLDLNLSFDNFNHKCSSINIILTDFYDENVKSIISLYYINDTLYLRVDEKDIVLGNQETIELLYNPINSNLKFTKNSSLDTTYFANKFNSDRVYLGFEFIGVNQSSRLIINNINNQILNNRSYDFFEPQIYAYPLDGIYSPGATIYVSKANYGDVLSPRNETKYKMELYYLDENGQQTFVRANDGTLLDGSQDNNKEYYVTCDKIGKYIANYYYEDQSYRNGNLLPNPYNFYLTAEIIDDIAPSLILSNYSDQYVDHSSEVSIRDFTVSDNVSEKEKLTIIIIVYSPNQESIDVTNSKKFVANRSGEWIVTYYVSDENGNTSIASYKVIVKGAK